MQPNIIITYKCHKVREDPTHELLKHFIEVLALQTRCKPQLNSKNAEMGVVLCRLTCWPENLSLMLQVFSNIIIMASFGCNHAGTWCSNNKNSQRFKGGICTVK